VYPRTDYAMMLVRMMMMMMMMMTKMMSAILKTYEEISRYTHIHTLTHSNTHKPSSQSITVTDTNVEVKIYQQTVRGIPSRPTTHPTSWTLYYLTSTTRFNEQKIRRQ